MPKRTYAPHATRSAKKRRPMRRSIKGKRLSRARPMRSLKTNYRANNVYRFVRETMPSHVSFSIIPGGTSFSAMGYLNFDNLQFNQLVSAQAEFGALFARYKVDKIETILTPLWETVNQDGAYLSIRVTRVNTKWMNESFAIQANADLQLAELAQIQAKSVSNYASHRSLKVTTMNPGVMKKGVLDSTGAELSTRGPAPWLNVTTESNVPLSHNSIMFMERTDGGALTTAYKYRVVHKVYFRCSQVG